MKPKRIKSLEELASAIVGDGKAPNLYFVTDQGNVTMITRDKTAARQAWCTLADRRPLVECALEDRQTGCISSVEPDSDEPGAKLRRMD